MFILNWDGSHGTAAAGGQSWALRIKPDIGIEFDALGYSMGGGSKTIGTQTVPLTSDDVLRIEQWISVQNPHQTTDDYIHGADATGRYLGLVAKEQAAFVLLGPPPSDKGWRWDVDGGVWVRVMSLSEAQTQALEDIDALADGIYKTVIGGRQSEYDEAFKEAQAFVASGYNGFAGPCITSWAFAKGSTNSWAADDIISTAAAWQGAMQNIRAARLLAKEQVRSAQSMGVVLQSMAVYSATMGAVRAGLGL
jgi:hypothetical protein